MTTLKSREKLTGSGMAHKTKLPAHRQSGIKPLSHKLRLFVTQNTGGAAVEFAIAFWAFLFFFAFLLEFALIIWGNTMIDYAVTQAARRGMVGCIASTCEGQFLVDPAMLRRNIRTQTAGMVDACSDQFTFEVAPVAPGASPATFNPGSVNLGASEEIVAYRAQYEWDILFPMLEIQALFGQFVNYDVSILVRNEPFGANAGERVGGGGGC